MQKLIIVLAHPRTGSSLLMQTLKLLNVEIIGRFERKDLPQQANPRGYYEDCHILRKGLTDRAIEKIEKNKAGTIAVKVALRWMIEEDRLNQWQYMQAKNAVILVPIRPPLESALSRMVFRTSYDKIIRFTMITSFLRDYQLHFKALSRLLLTKVPELLPNIHIVKYSIACDNPQRYINDITDISSLIVSEVQFNNALGNIDPALYTYNQTFFEEDLLEWNRKIGADIFYDILSTQKNPWRLIDDLYLKVP